MKAIERKEGFFKFSGGLGLVTCFEFTITIINNYYRLFVFKKKKMQKMPREVKLEFKFSSL